jgi:hypothetical protein
VPSLQIPWTVSSMRAFRNKTGPGGDSGMAAVTTSSLPSLGLIVRGTGSQGYAITKPGGSYGSSPPPPGGAPRRAAGDAAVLRSAQ